MFFFHISLAVGWFHAAELVCLNPHALNSGVIASLVVHTQSAGRNEDLSTERLVYENRDFCYPW